MIVVDSSAIVAILQEEPEAQRFLELIKAEQCFVSAATVFEAAIVMNFRRGAGGVSLLMDLLEASGAEIRPFTSEMIGDAVVAYQRYGKGTTARAKLNFGDCISYVLAKSLDAPLLFKGNDFAETHVKVRR